MIVTWYVPKTKFWYFHQILCETGGRYISNPNVLQDVVLVTFKTDNIVQMQDLWYKFPNEVVEIRKDQWWRKLLRRFWINV
jgi:hypothetical protein